MAYFIPHPVVLTPVTPYEQARALFNQRQAQVNQLKIQLAHLQAPAALGLPVNTALKLVMTQLVQARIQRDLAKVHKDSLDPRLIASKVASTGKAKSGSSGKRSSGKAKSGSSKRSSGKAKSRSSKTSGYHCGCCHQLQLLPPVYCPVLEPHPVYCPVLEPHPVYLFPAEQLLFPAAEVSTTSKFNFINIRLLE